MSPQTFLFLRSQSAACNPPERGQRTFCESLWRQTESDQNFLLWWAAVWNPPARKFQNRLIECFHARVLPL
ncbi:hypothetical protein CA951_33460 [Rhodococcus sp. NCIMB 12038]|nr:hypothetical protein CA951_33460 [Rhodococcus sp. NCIMB 12038]